MAGQGAMAGRSRWVCHGSPICLPATCLLSSDTGGPGQGQGRFGSLLSWWDHSGASGSLVISDDQRWKIGLDEEGAAGREGHVELWFLYGGSLDLEMGRGLPQQPSSSAKWIGQAVLVGEDTAQEAGASCAAAGAVDPAAMRGKGAGPIQVWRRGGSQPPLSGRVYGTPTGLALMAFGDERLSLPRLGVGAWVTEAALYSLGAGAVTWSRGEDIVGAWGGGLLAPHHNDAILVLVFLLPSHPCWIPV